LYDLPAEGRQQKRPQARPASTLTAEDTFVNRTIDAVIENFWRADAKNRL